ncbi:hypothetical protein PG997_010183 [Apiospora hydei]|uniref:Transmembrane protein n=1 Tax=Apiospora hydei TaxID=1337664 RepID=A0ABR1VW80_9PEZI
MPPGSHATKIGLRVTAQTPGHGRTSHPGGFVRFLRDHWVIAGAFMFGLSFCLGVFGYINTLSNQAFSCPPWAVNCDLTGPVKFLLANNSLLQGALTTGYSIGLAAMGFSICSLGEAALWPLWHRRAYKLRHIDTYLAASRGSLISLAKALITARCPQAIMVVVCIFVSAALQPAGPTFVGFALARTNVTTVYQSNQTVGGGMGLGFEQQKLAPARLPGAISDAIALYTAWAKSLAVEPLPDQRDYILDRDMLSPVGNASVFAVRANRTIDCLPRRVDLVDTGLGYYRVNTTLPPDNSVSIRVTPALNAWVEKITIQSPTRVISTLVFANLNGRIEGGENVVIESQPSWSGVSGVVCTVDTTLWDAHVNIGNAKTPPRMISSLDSIKSPMDNTRLDEVVTWISVAPTLMGMSVQGTQPTFRKSEMGLPQSWTTQPTMPEDTDSSNFTRKELEDFIAVSGGAICTCIPGKFAPVSQSGFHYDAFVTLDSEYFDAHIDPTRTLILLVPVFIITIAGIILTAFNAAEYRRHRIPYMRLATVGELIKSAQTEHIREKVGAEESGDVNTYRKIDELHLRFGVCSDGVIGLGETVP